MKQLDVFRAWIDYYHRFNRVGVKADDDAREEAVTALRAILAAAQNTPPMGTSDGSMPIHVWGVARALVDEMAGAAKSAARVTSLSDQIRTGTYAHVDGGETDPPTSNGWGDDDIPF